MSCSMYKTKPQNEVMSIFAFERWLEGNQNMNYHQVKYNATGEKTRRYYKHKMMTKLTIWVTY